MRACIAWRVNECVTDAGKELGYPEMKPEQFEVAATTGFGKSLCYACLPLAFDKFTELKNITA